jgi:hypothetical protein
MTTYLKRSVDEIINWSEKQITQPTQNWQGLCQSHVRQAMGIGAWASSAINAWNSIPRDKRTDTRDPFSAPRGSAIYYSGGQYGHVVIAVGKSTSDKCLSNDYVRNGWIDKAPRNFPRWGLTCVGWSFWTPMGEVRPDGPQKMWDGTVPDIDNVFAAMNNADTPNSASYRLACRLFDLGLYAGTPKANGSQGYPVKAMMNWHNLRKWDANPLGAYSPAAHKAIFG